MTAIFLQGPVPAFLVRGGEEEDLLPANPGPPPHIASQAPLQVGGNNNNFDDDTQMLTMIMLPMTE
jgi:hypothetical protein